MSRALWITVSCLIVGVVLLAQQAPLPPRTAADDGFTDTPRLPGLPWRVHDPARPHPPVVTPGATPGAAPSDAVMLFDGRDLSKWAHRGTGADSAKLLDPKWPVRTGYFESGRSGSLYTRDSFGDVQLHVEWASPSVIAGNSQGRGNSGIFLMGLYEIQVLDSYNNRTYADGQAGAIYGQWPPLANVARKSGEWQSYDIVFEAPRFDGGKLVKPAFQTVLWNGVVIHNRQEVLGATVWRDVAKYSPHAAELPLMLQDHENPVRYRNIWVRRLGSYDRPQTAAANDITVMTSGAFTAAYLELLPQFERTTNEKLVTAATTMGTGLAYIPSRLQRGEPADVVIVADDSLIQLIKDGLVLADSRVELARSNIGMAVRAGAPKPDISSVAAFKTTLLQAKSIAYSASVSGVYLTTELFQRLGIADQVLGKSRRIDTERVGAVVARGEAELGFQQIAELLPVPGIDYVGPLPPEVQKTTVFSAGIAAHSKNATAARALIKFLASPKAADAITKSGMEPIRFR